MAAAHLASIAASNGSQESFHSTHSEQRSAVDLRVAAAVHAATPQDFELNLPDVENFLNEPSTVALLASQAPSKKPTRSTDKQVEGSSSDQVQAAPPRTSHYVSLLYLEAQQRGLTPEFEYEGHQLDGFKGSVTISGQTFSSDKRWPNKKEAKEGLSEMVLPFVKAIEHRVKVSSMPQENWIGKLLGETAFLESLCNEPNTKFCTMIQSIITLRHPQVLCTPNMCCQVPPSLAPVRYQAILRHLGGKIYHSRVRRPLV